MSSIMNQFMKQDTTPDKKFIESSLSENFCEFDDDNSLYKNCINCGQGQYPFKHGICRICGDLNWNVRYEAVSYNQSEAEMYD